MLQQHAEAQPGPENKNYFLMEKLQEKSQSLIFWMCGERPVNFNQAEKHRAEELPAKTAVPLVSTWGSKCEPNFTEEVNVFTACS